MAEQQDNAAALRAALAQPTTSTQLPKVGKTRQFGLAFAGALDPAFQESTAGPILEAERNRTQLQGQLDEKARLQNINQLLAINELDRQGVSDERAAAKEGRAVAGEVRAQEKFEAGKEDREALQEAQSNIFSATLASLPDLGERLEAAAVAAEEEMESPERASYIRGLLAELRLATNTMIDDEGNPVEDTTGLAEESMQDLMQKIDEAVTDTFENIEQRRLTEEEVKAALELAMAKGVGATKPSSEAQLKIAGLNTTLAQADKFEKFQADHPNVGGAFSGRIVPDALNALQAEKQALVDAMVAPFIRMQSGAAVTETELERIKGLLVNVNVSDDINKTRLGVFRDFVEQMRDDILRRFQLIEASGVDVSNMTPAQREIFAQTIAAQSGPLPIADQPIPEGFDLQEGQFRQVEGGGQPEERQVSGEKFGGKFAPVVFPGEIFTDERGRQRLAPPKGN